MTKSTTTPAEGKPAAPALHLVPTNLGAIVKHAGENGRYGLNGVFVRFAPGAAGEPERYAAEATDTKHLVRIEGACNGPVEEYPTVGLPGLHTAPNGATKALVPTSAWAKTFTAAERLTRRFRGLGNTTKSVAVVLGEAQTTFGATDTEQNQFDTTPNLDGRYPPTDEIVESAVKAGGLRVGLSARYLKLICETALKVLAEGDGSERIDLVIPPPEPGKGVTAPVVLEAATAYQKLTAVLMPMCSG